MLNTITKGRHNVVNFICLLLKQYIYKQRCQEKNLNFSAFQAHVKNIENTEKYIAIKHGKLDKHVRKWSKNQESGRDTDDSNNLEEYIHGYLEGTQ